MKRFNIRDIFWLLLVVGLALGWWNSHRQMSGHLQKTHQDLRAARSLIYSWENTAIGLARAFRDQGWHVKVDADGSGFGYTTPDVFVDDPEGLEELNDKYPLPQPGRRWLRTLLGSGGTSRRP